MLQKIYTGTAFLSKQLNIKTFTDFASIINYQNSEYVGDACSNISSLSPGAWQKRDTEISYGIWHDPTSPGGERRDHVYA